MGIEKVRMCVSVDEATRDGIDRLLERFWPAAKNRSQMVELMYSLFSRLLSTNATIQAITDACLSLNRNTQCEFEFPDATAAQEQARAVVLPLRTHSRSRLRRLINRRGSPTQIPVGVASGLGSAYAADRGLAYTTSSSKFRFTFAGRQV